MSDTSWILGLVFGLILGLVSGLVFTVFVVLIQFTKTKLKKPTKPTPDNFPPLHHNCRCEIPKVPDIPSISIPGIPSLPNVPNVPSIPKLPDFQTFSIQVDVPPPTMEETQAMIETWKRIAWGMQGRPLETLRPPAGTCSRELWAVMRKFGAGYVELWAYATIDFNNGCGQPLEFKLRGRKLLGAPCTFDSDGGMSTNSERK